VGYRPAIAYLIVAYVTHAELWMTTAHQRFVYLHATAPGAHERAVNPVASAGSRTHTESVNPDNRVSRERIQYDATLVTRFDLHDHTPLRDPSRDEVADVPAEA
jgi:hypothetical protein